MVMEQLLGTKKETEGKSINIELSNSGGKRSKFDLVAVGTCPHCGGSLDSEIPTAGRGVRRKCSSCGQIWYLNRKIRTCKCVPCIHRHKSETFDTNNTME